MTPLLYGLIWIGLPLLLIYLLTHRQQISSDKLVQLNAQRDQMWLKYIASFNSVVKTDKEKHLLDILTQGKTTAEFNTLPPKMSLETPTQNQSAGLTASQLVMPTLVNKIATTRSMPAVDNTILLLYFGAFLLVTSVGLFVAIGGLGGLLRTVIVGITAAVLYLGGFKLYQTNKRLAQAGVSFVGTGMIIAPLTGVAWYNLVSGQSDAGLIWLITSIVCIALYAHAFSRIKNEFIAYLLIGSFVSSIESAVLTINLPAYGYTWGLIAAALLLITNSRLRGQSIEFNKTSDTSSKLLIPLSVLGSIALFPQFGSIQLAITLFLSGIYYSLLALWQTRERTLFSTSAQLSFIAAVVSMVYESQKTLIAIGVTLIIIAIMYSVMIIFAKQETLKNHNLVEIVVISNFIAVLLSLGKPWPLVAGLGVATALAVIVWQKLQSDQVLQVGGLLLAGLPFVVGQYALQADLGSWTQLSLCLPSAVLIGILVAATSRLKSYKSYASTASILYILAAVLLLIPAAALGFSVLSGVTLGIMASFALLRYLANDSKWLLCSGITILVPLLYALFGYGIADIRFSVAVAAALVWNVGVSLVTRQALVRWLVVGCILIAPFAIGAGGIGIHWGYAGYASGYLLAMGSCILARAIARGKLLVSFKVPIASYYTEASQAYVAGYTLAAVISVVVSLSDAHSQLVTTLLLGIIALSVIVVARIEHNNQLLALLPFIAQAILFSSVRPDINNGTAIGLIAVISTLLAAGAYAAVSLISHAGANNAAAVRFTRLAGVLSAYIGPTLVMTQSHPSLLLPVSLFAAGLLTYEYNRSARQDIKELSLAVCIISIHWLVLLLGYSNIHIHTHLLAVFLAGFAVWRSDLHDSKASQSYIEALFLVVTVPLALQSLAGNSGGPYGLLLIGEQVFFMVAGATFGQRFLLRWGLWTALAAILFQLRGLGWAFLSLLALIIIGVAVYRLQKHPPSEK